MKIYEWFYSFAYAGGPYNTVEPLFDDEPDPPDDPDTPDPPEPDDEPDPPDPDDDGGEPDPPDDDDPDPPDPENSYIGCSMGSRSSEWLEKEGYDEVAAEELWSLANDAGIGDSMWETSPHAFVSSMLSLISERLEACNGRAWVTGISDLPVRARWCVVVWCRHRGFCVQT